MDTLTLVYYVKDTVNNRNIMCIPNPDGKYSNYTDCENAKLVNK